MGNAASQDVAAAEGSETVTEDPAVEELKVVT